MSTRDLSALLRCIPGVRHACDLDLLLFFHRHPCALLTVEQLVKYLGYDRERVTKSLEALIEAGLVTRSQNPSHTARLYVLEAGSHPEGSIASFLKIAATRQGRHDVMRLLAPESAHAPDAGFRRPAPLVQVA